MKKEEKHCQWAADLREKLMAKKMMISKAVSQIEGRIQREAIEQAVRSDNKPAKQKRIQVNPDFTFGGQNREEGVSLRNNWQFSKPKESLKIEKMLNTMYYPPSCSGYGMAYSKEDDCIYVFGGISCSSQIDDGIKPYFYKLMGEQWGEVKTDSHYNPIPRFGHTLTTFQKELLLFGGVSEYKQKLKDRCFYSQLSSFSIPKNNWKVIEVSGSSIRSRKNHAACTYLKYYLVSGGIGESDEIQRDLNWVCLEGKKPYWKTIRLQPRFNHKMVAIENQNGRDFLCIFGGRNSAAEMAEGFLVFPMNCIDGELFVKEPTEVAQQMSLREMPMISEVSKGILILGGIDDQNRVVEDSWYLDGETQAFMEMQLPIDYSGLRGAQGVSISRKQVYVLSNNSDCYKALKITSLD